MKLAFFGTDDFSVIVLDELKRARLDPSLVITAPDKPRGRGLRVSSSPVKQWAQKNKVAFLQLEKLDASSSILLASKIVDCFVVASYGKIIPKAILAIPKCGTLNVHPSLLPRFRGPSPIESQILAGEKNIGVTIMLMDEKMDHGPILAKRELGRLDILKAFELRKILAEEGGKLLAETIPKWVSGEIQAVPQDETKATYTKKFTKVDGELKLTDDPWKNFLKIRAFEGGIGTYFLVGTTRLKITEAQFEDSTLKILRVIPEGKKEMSYEDFVRGMRK